MTHVRTQLRNALANTALASLKPETGDGEIYASRYRPVTNYPSIIVFNGNERTDTENPGYINTSEADKRYRRFQDFVIEIAVEQSENADTALDDLCELVEAAVAADEQIVNAIIAIDMIGTTFTGSTGQGTDQLHIAQLTYRVEYRTGATAPDTALA